jgi:hypothetical protein
MRRPTPPDALLTPNVAGRFVPSVPLARWLRETFIESTGAAHNPDHSHLGMADIRCLWTNVPYERQQRSVAATCEIPRPPQGASRWHRSRWEQQIVQWFGVIPDFIITMYAPAVAKYDRASFMATSEHELYHASIARYTQAGTPIWGIKGHDVEEHTGVMRRYGTAACGEAVVEFVQAARQEPLIGRAQIAAACGTCLKAVA